MNMSRLCGSGDVPVRCNEGKKKSEWHVGRDHTLPREGDERAETPARETKYGYRHHVRATHRIEHAFGEKRDSRGRNRRTMIGNTSQHVKAAFTGFLDVAGTMNEGVP